jgi:hypothetical protein
MATDRDEQLRQQRELEEIRRSFAEMGARMGSLFEPPESEEHAPEQADQADQPERAAISGPPALRAPTGGGGKELAVPAIPATTAAPPRSGVSTWPRWWLVGSVIVLLLAGTTLGYLLPRTGGAAEPPAASPEASATTPPPTPRPVPTTGFRTRTTVPEVCLETARLGDAVIARLTSNIRDERLSLALRDYTIASQACRKEASR